MKNGIVILEKKLWVKGFEDWFFILHGDIAKFKDILRKYDCVCDFEYKWCLCNIFIDKYLKFLNDFEKKGCKIDKFEMDSKKKLLVFLCP